MRYNEITSFWSWQKWTFLSSNVTFPCISSHFWADGYLRVHVGKPVGLTLVFEPLRTYIGTLELEQVFLCRSNRKVCANRRQPVYKHLEERKSYCQWKQTVPNRSLPSRALTVHLNPEHTQSRDVEFLLSGVTCIVSFELIRQCQYC